MINQLGQCAIEALIYTPIGSRTGSMCNTDMELNKSRDKPI